MPLESKVVKDSLFYEDVPVDILDRQVRRLRNKEVSLVKILWRSQLVEGDTWKYKQTCRPSIFTSFLPIPFNLEVIFCVQLLSHLCVNLVLVSGFLSFTCISA